MLVSFSMVSLNNIISHSVTLRHITMVYIHMFYIVDILYKYYWIIVIFEVMYMICMTSLIFNVIYYLNYLIIGFGQKSFIFYFIKVIMGKIFFSKTFMTHFHDYFPKTISFINSKKLYNIE